MITITQSKTFSSASVCRLAQTVRKPGDAVGLAAAGRVLDQVVVARAFDSRCGDESVDRVELVVAREDDRLALDRSRTLLVLDLLFARLGEDVGANDVEESAHAPGPSCQK